MTIVEKLFNTGKVNNVEISKATDDQIIIMLTKLPDAVSKGEIRGSILEAVKAEAKWRMSKTGFATMRTLPMW